MSILKESKKLKTANDQLKRVYLKKDIHPGINREINTLRFVEKQEKAKPENEGRVVIFDQKERCVKIDDIIIDTFHPNFF